MNLKDDLLQLLGKGGSRQTDEEPQLQSHFPVHFTDGLCIICENREHCVWVENDKIFCNHYE